MKSPRLLFVALFTLLVAARFCHLDILWAEETLPLAAAAQMARGKILYREIWFDKPPLLAALYRLEGARDGWVLRLAGALYGLLACWIAWRFARDLWGAREAFWAAALLAFSLLFDTPSAVTPLAADLLMLAPHIAAVWLAWRRRAFWAGVLAGLAFLVNAKGVFVLAACLFWNWRAAPLLAAGFLLPNAVAAVWLWAQGALHACVDQVWAWGRVYAGVTFLDHPVANGLRRTANWLGFHATIAAAAAWFWWRDARPRRMQWTAWAALSLVAVALGWRFFPRYYFAILPVAVLAAARGIALLDRRCALLLAALLAIPMARFGPRYVSLAADRIAHRPTHWVDIAMDQDSRRAATLVRQVARPGDTLFVWGFRPELYIYTGLPAAIQFLDSQPLTGVPADRHLTQSRPVDNDAARAHRALLSQSSPTIVIDGLGAFNPQLAPGAYDDLHTWLARYDAVSTTGLTTVYRLRR